MKENITLKLTQAQGLVLLEAITRLSEEAIGLIKDQAEERILWDVEAMLEKQLVDLLNNNYELKLAEARDIVRDEK